MNILIFQIMFDDINILCIMTHNMVIELLQWPISNILSSSHHSSYIWMLNNDFAMITIKIWILQFHHQ